MPTRGAIPRATASAAKQMSLSLPISQPTKPSEPSQPHSLATKVPQTHSIGSQPVHGEPPPAKASFLVHSSLSIAAESIAVPVAVHPVAVHSVAVHPVAIRRGTVRCLQIAHAGPSSARLWHNPSRPPNPTTRSQPRHFSHPIRHSHVFPMVFPFLSQPRCASATGAAHLGSPPCPRSSPNPRRSTLVAQPSSLHLRPTAHVPEP